MCITLSPAFFMPIYEYLSEDPDDPDRSCYVCRKAFELRRPLSRGDLLECPMCRNGIVKLPSGYSIGKEQLSDSKAKAAGFTVLENKGDGILEKI